MITHPTVFILGAGASKPYGFPTGKELRVQIITEFVNENIFVEAQMPEYLALRGHKKILKV